MRVPKFIEPTSLFIGTLNAITEPTDLIHFFYSIVCMLKLVEANLGNICTRFSQRQSVFEDVPRVYASTEPIPMKVNTMCFPFTNICNAKTTVRPPVKSNIFLFIIDTEWNLCQCRNDWKYCSHYSSLTKKVQYIPEYEGYQKLFCLKKGKLGSVNTCLQA